MSLYLNIVILSYHITILFSVILQIKIHFFVEMKVIIIIIYYYILSNVRHI